MTVTSTTPAHELLLAHFDALAEAPGGIARLRRLILQLAVQGRLVPQDPSDEPASVLLERIHSERAQLVKEGKIKRAEPSAPVADEEQPFDVPQGWEWARFSEVATIASNLVQPQKFGNLPHIAPDNIEKQSGQLLSYRTVAEDGVTSPKHHFFPGQILYSKIRPNLAKAVIVDFGGLCSADMYPIEAQIDTTFLWQYMLSAAFLAQSVKKDTRVAMPKINQEELSRILVSVPPLAEQRRIVARVEQLTRLCDALEARLREERAAAERLAEVLCAAVMAGQAVEQPDTASTWAPAEEAAILELPARMPRLVPAAAMLDDYAVFAARVVQRHQGTPHASSLGHVKLEKIAHLAEGWGGVELGRRPQRKPRGPVDFELLEHVIARGRELDAFDAPQRESAEWGYKFVALPRLDDLAARLGDTFGASAARLEQLLDLTLPLSTRQAEAVATLYAVWNDMLRAGQQPDDEQIFAAFWIFHPKKKRFKQETLERWLSWMRKHGIVPDGSAKPTLPASQHDEAPAPIGFAAAAQQRRSAQRAAETPSAYDAGDNYARAAALLAERGALTNGELQAALGLDGSAARALLKQLVAEGLATAEGQKRGTRYMWRG
jgi:type I restriction enzyme, S subunit